jgi:hypothetical protein
MTDPQFHDDAQEDATNQGVSTQDPAEGGDDAPAGGDGSPDPATPDTVGG